LNLNVSETSFAEPAAVLALRVGLVRVINAEEDNVQPHSRDRFEPAVVQSRFSRPVVAARRTAGKFFIGIEEASKCCVDAFQHDEADVPGLVVLDAKLSRMSNAETITRKIQEAYLEPDESFVKFRDMANNGTIDLLREFLLNRMRQSDFR
jgi:hypothetical protein